MNAPNTPSKRRGKLRITAGLYNSSEIDDALSALKVKVYSITFDVFNEIYEIYFTSVFIDEVDEYEIPEYWMFVDNNEYSFKLAH